MVDLFNEPIFISRPLLPNLENMNRKLSEIWVSKWVTNNGLQQKTLEEKLMDYLRVDNLSLFTNDNVYDYYIGKNILDSETYDLLVDEKKRDHSLKESYFPQYRGVI